MITAHMLYLSIRTLYVFKTLKDKMDFFPKCFGLESFFLKIWTTVNEEKVIIRLHEDLKKMHQST